MLISFPPHPNPLPRWGEGIIFSPEAFVGSDKQDPPLSPLWERVGVRGM